LKIPKLNTGNVVQIEWVDSKSAMGWTYNPRMKRTPGYIHSIGYVVQSNDECVTITTSLDDRGASIDDFSIPIGTIKALDILEGYTPEGLHV
jgi:hypothetical protein